jgi:hypothetical protein
MCVRIHVEDTRDIAHVAGLGGEGEGRRRGGLAGGAGVSMHCDVALTGACDAATTLYAAGLAAPQVVQQARNLDPSPFRFLGNIIVLAILIAFPILAQYKRGQWFLHVPLLASYECRQSAKRTPTEQPPLCTSVGQGQHLCAFLYQASLELYATSTPCPHRESTCIAHV